MLALRLASLFGFLAVALGAFGAHGLQKIVAPAMLHNWETGALYHLVHSVVLLAIAFFTAPAAGEKPRIPVAFWLFATGITLFSGSLYVYTLTGVKKLAMITPIGGGFILLGWLALAFMRRGQTNT